MIIPSIDLMDGQAVQLRQGKERVLIAERRPQELVQDFNRFGDVAVIDLDAALNTQKKDKPADNLALIKALCRLGNVRVGGGIRTVERGKTLLRAGAQKLIIGTSAEPDFLMHFPPSRVLVALDHLKSGEVVDHGWTKGTGESVLDRAKRLAPYCSGFLVTFVEDEGCMAGMSPEAVLMLTEQLPHPLTVAGGVNTTENAVAVMKQGVDVQVGMALYTGMLDLSAVVVQSLDFQKQQGLIPTIVQDVDSKQVLMLAYSSPESLKASLESGKGIYFSRSRQALWEKGQTSGHTQKLISARVDCDQDTLLFQVQQTGAACHTGSASCFGDAAFSMPTLFETLRHRKEVLPKDSFSAQLFTNRKKLLRKVMEEAFEVATCQNQDELIWEISDLIYMTSVLAVDEGLSWQDLMSELGGRHR
ncbi:MAG: bifunctional phosphoribosyl-AMP cyclohydrolase/phosphoribosyl-ATP diphosphatase HisIE [Vampirovibrionales bacterium]|nr:bifunctional phosphoribosyl-AMP cyclohydrolase/phosphoribosyl-ATP diphosphatase HisIE [Vampirovibrionales bacterium]